MNNEEAKFVLSAYRPGGEDASDARFAEALGQVEHDPELATWFAAERRFDSALSDALEAVPLPRDLRAKILAGGEVSRPRTWSTRRSVVAIAAAVVLLAGVASLWLKGTPGLDRWQRDALAVIPMLGTAESQFDMKNPDGAVLQQWLRTQNAPVPETLPMALQDSAALGCKTIKSDGRMVSIICFKMGDGEFVHLIVTDEENLSHPPPARPRFYEENGWQTVSWSAHGRACMLATTGPERELRAVLRTAVIVTWLRLTTR